MHSRAYLAAVAALVLVGGCNGDSATGPSQPADLATVLNSTDLSPFVGGMGSDPELSKAAVPNAPACTYSSATSSFVCPNVSVTGLTVERGYTLLASDGSSQSAFNASTTSAVRVTSRVTGTFNSSPSTFAFDQQQTMTVSGLLTGRHVLDGVSTTRSIGTFTLGTETLPIDNTLRMTVTRLVLPRGTDKYPESGTIVVEDANAAGSSPTIRSELVFNGTSKVALTLTVGAFVSRCTLDLGATSNPLSCT